MDMTLSKRGDYVTRAAISLARAFDVGRPRKIREVVAETEVPQTFASQILADLVRAGLATSKAGRDGGYRLARPPAEISVLEVVEAAEGPLRAERCALGEGPCRWEAVCPLHETWSEATGALRDLLAGTNLGVLAQRDAAIEAGTYAVPADAHRSHPASLAVADAVQVELSAADTQVALARAAKRLGALVDAVVARGLDAETPNRPGGARLAGPSRTDASLVPVGEPSAGAAEKAPCYLLAWRIVDGARPSRLEAELSVHALDPERVELHIDGTFYAEEKRPPEAAELQRRARATVRAFLRHLARELEEEPAVRSPGRVRGANWLADPLAKQPGLDRGDPRMPR